MARTTGRSGFKMKSGNSSSFKMMGSSSPLHGRKEDKTKYESMNAVHKSITGDMTDQQLRDIAVSQHGGKASKFNVDMNYLKKLRTSRKPKEKALKETPADSTTSEVVAPATLQESRDVLYNRENFKEEGWFSDTPEPTPERKKEVSKASKSGYMRNLQQAVESKYGKPIHEIQDPEDYQMAADAMTDDEGNILPMSSPSGQWSGRGSKAARVKKRK
jgi:hypothetical protein